MTLPNEPRMAWPPERMANAFSTYAEHAAWYSGEVERLAATSGGSDVNRRRWRFWDRQATAPTDRTKLHVPIASDIAVTSADLLFAEPIEVTCEDEATQVRLDEILADGGVHNTLLEAAETGAALGGTFLKVAWDTEVPYPILETVQADQAIPEWRYGRLSAATFWWVVLEDSDAVWRHLERHSPGMIEHGLYKGTKTSLGHAMPLTEHPSTAGIAEHLTGANEIATGIESPTAYYVPNMRPNRRYRNTPLGRSDYDGVEGLFDALDEVYTSWMRDIRLAKARLMVPQGWLDTAGKGKGASFDTDREVFVELNYEDSGGITANQFAIRVDEHRDTATALVERIVATAGYSGRTFGLQSESGNITATEVASEERRSLITRAKKSRYWAPELAGILTAMLEVDRVHLGGKATPERPTVAFPEAVAQDPRAQAETLDLLNRAEAASTETRVAMLHPEWPAERVAAEAAAIQAEAGTAVPDPMGLGAVV